MTDIQTVVQKNFDIMAPFITRDEGKVPPILFLQFEYIDEAARDAMNTNQNDDTLDIENGFFVPMVNEDVMRRRDVFFNLMSTVAATLTTSKVCGKLTSVSIALCVEATKMSDQSSSLDLFFVSGEDKDGNRATVGKQLLSRLGSEGIVYDLVDTEILGDSPEDISTAMVGDFFDQYNKTVKQLPEDKKNLKFIQEATDEYEDDPGRFTSELVQAAIHSTVLITSVDK